jgi:hypothetical protein
MSQVSFAEYPTPPGGKPMSMCDVTGPASYTQMVNGTAPAIPTGGQSVAASFWGLVGIQWAHGGLSESGTYIVQVMLSPFGQNTLASALLLRWITQSSGAEASPGANLSGETVRLMVIGR